MGDDLRQSVQDEFARMLQEEIDREILDGMRQAMEGLMQVRFPNGRLLNRGEIPEEAGFADKVNDDCCFIADNRDEADRAIEWVRKSHLAAGLGDPGLVAEEYGLGVKNERQNVQVPEQP